MKIKQTEMNMIRMTSLLNEGTFAPEETVRKFLKSRDFKEKRRPDGSSEFIPLSDPEGKLDNVIYFINLIKRLKYYPNPRSRNPDTFSNSKQWIYTATKRPMVESELLFHAEPEDGGKWWALSSVIITERVAR